ncbi:DUF5806 family protein [Natrinema versiforme]|uniref:Uncharacterized protein n=1 Tax=Natrinema versiforme JCM 10478 TaxID=1227496 RepID=L9Y5K0_9EURY|nr:DUF5806 family protein [Natrinema versiforme]ELY68926.1 hypothetical protein C489_06153 [Natrinema versiforme JCM 10478]
MSENDDSDDDSENKHTGNPEGDRFTKLRGAEYDRVNDLLRDQTTLTAREWAIARVCNDFRTGTGIKYTAAGEALPDIVPFMADEYSAGAVSSAKHRFDTKVQEAAGTLLYGALCGVYTTDELDEILHDATEVAKFLIELEGGEIDHEHELEAEQQLADAMREVREKSVEVRDRLESEDDDGGE